MAGQKRMGQISCKGAFEMGGRLPYQPLVESLPGRIERENAPDDLLSDAWLAELSRLLPNLRDRYPGLRGTSRSQALAMSIHTSSSRMEREL